MSAERARTWTAGAASLHRAACGAFGLLLLWPELARASIGDLITSLGQRLGAAAPAVPKPPTALSHGPARQLRLNGFPIKVLTGAAPGSVTDVLGFYREQFVQIGKPGTIPPFAVRHAGPDAGYLLGISPERAALVRTIEQHLPLTSAGPLRMVYAQRQAGVTHYLAAWSESPLPDGLLTPDRERDAPGEDLPGVPRPRGVRAFSLSEPEAGYTLVTYRVSDRPDAAVQDAVTRLREAGFADDPSLAAVNAELQLRRPGQPMAHLQRSDRELLVSARTDPAHTGSKLTYLSRAR